MTDYDWSWGSRVTTGSSIEDIKAFVGHDSYRRMRQLAWELAVPDEGDFPPPEAAELADFARELGRQIWETVALGLTEKLDLTLRVYSDLPNYSVLTYLGLGAPTLSAGERQLIWSRLLDPLDSPDVRLAHPVGQFLQDNVFGHDVVAAEAWRFLTADLGRERSLKILVTYARTMQTSQKLPVYRGLLPRYDWAHDAISADLFSSAFDLMGGFEVDAATAIAALLDDAEAAGGATREGPSAE